jgi:hypothetical protein
MIKAKIPEITTITTEGESFPSAKEKPPVPIIPLTHVTQNATIDDTIISRNAQNDVRKTSILPMKDKRSSLRRYRSATTIVRRRGGIVKIAMRIPRTGRNRNAARHAATTAMKVITDAIENLALET